MPPFPMGTAEEWTLYNPGHNTYIDNISISSLIDLLRIPIDASAGGDAENIGDLASLDVGRLEPSFHFRKPGCGIVAGVTEGTHKKLGAIPRESQGCKLWLDGRVSSFLIVIGCQDG